MARSRGRPTIGDKPMTSSERNRRRLDRLISAEKALGEVGFPALAADETQEFLAANRNLVEATPALIAKDRATGEWFVFIAETGGDGVFRHVDHMLGFDYSPAIHCLRAATAWGLKS